MRYLLVLLLLFGCDNSGMSSEGSQPGDCTDDADNDADGLFDCADPGCAGASACMDGGLRADADPGVDASWDGEVCCDSGPDAMLDARSDVPPSGDWLPPLALGYEDFESVPLGGVARHADGHQWFSGDSTEVVNIAAEGIPAHGGGGTQALRSDWRVSECMNRTLTRVGRTANPPGGVGDIVVSEDEAVWVRGRFYLPEGFQLDGADGECTSGEGGGLSAQKFIRLLGTGVDLNLGDNGVHVIASQNDAWNMDQVPERSGAGPDTPRGEWFTYEVYARFSPSDARPGDLKIWVNNERVFTSRGSEALDPEFSSLDRIEILYYWNAGVPRDQSHYVDDLVMTEEPQNVDAEGFPFIGGAL